MLNAIRAVAVVAGACALSVLPAMGAEYPTRPVTMVVGLAAGGGTDGVARLLAEWLSRSLGHRVVVENRPGMGGNLGAQSVIKAPPDGHTILFMGPNNAGVEGPASIGSGALTTSSTSADSSSSPGRPCSTAAEITSVNTATEASTGMCSPAARASSINADSVEADDT